MDELLIKDVTIAVNALNAKKPIYDRLWDYYDGNHELMYSSGKLKEAFNGLNANFSLNWCEVVVNAVHERMELVQFVATGDKQKTRALNDWWEESEMDLDADDVELCALVTGEAFVIVWPEEDGVLGAYYNDSRLCHVFYEDDRPKQMRFAAKWWQAGSCLLYTSDAADD